MGYKYKKDESPEERIRNKLSVIFLTIEHASNGDCNLEMVKASLRVIPEINEHLDNIKEFYEKQNKCKNCS